MSDETTRIPQIDVDTDPFAHRIRIRAADPWAIARREDQLRRRRAFMKLGLLVLLALGFALLDIYLATH